MPQRPPYISVALISAASLAYEILLMRLFSIIQWHHFAYMIIGLALLGYGISGTIVSIIPKCLLPRYDKLYVVCLLLFGLSAPACFIAAQTLPFNAEEIFWNARQTVYLLSIFLLLTIPFFLAATGVCLTLMRFPDLVARTYAFDLIGAGAGSLGIVLLLYLVFPQSALLCIGIIGLLAAVMASWELHQANRLWTSFAIGLMVFMVLMAGQSLELNLSPYKSLPQILRINGTRIVEQRSSPLGLLSVVASDEVPLRHAPGLSLNAIQEPLAQLGVFTDADNMTVITQSPEHKQQLAYLDQITSALPYHLNQAKRVLIIGAGGGSDILQAKYHEVAHIDAIEINPQLIDLVTNTYHDYTGGLYQQDNIQLHIGEARDFFSINKHHYDVIQLALLDAFNASASGLYALNESYLYTTEALQLYFSQLESDGYLAITRWIKIPPRDTLKLFATAIDALKQSGIKSPGSQLALIRSWQTSTLIIKNGIFSPEQLNAIENFCAGNSFDLAYTPNITRDQVNRYNRLRQPVFYQSALALLGDNREAFLERYKFDLEPATDDQPYFHHFFKWSTFPEIFRLRHQGGMPLLESGYVVFIATLLIASLTSILLIVSPLWFFQRSQLEAVENMRAIKVIGYFFAIGLAFLFIEIAFIQKFILFLHHPIYATSVTLSAFFIFAGLGSHWSTRLAGQYSNQRAVMTAVIGITLLCLTYLLILAPLFATLAALSIGIKIVCSILLIAPLAFFMGMPFPLCMSNLAQHAQPLIPWAWGINGCASVISAVLATLLAIHFGFTVVILLAVLLYISAFVMFPMPQHGQDYS